MKFIFVLMPIASIWLLSAWENGAAGAWSVWTSLALMLLWGAMCELLGRRSGGR